MLFVDEAEDFLTYVNRGLGSIGYTVLTAREWEEARTILEETKSQRRVVFVEPLMAGQGRSEPEIVRQICSTARDVPILAVSSSRDPRTIAATIRAGAYDYLYKPISIKEFNRVIDDVLDRKAVRSTVPAKTAPVEFIYCNELMGHVYRTVRQIADTTVPVLITGESGVGKDVIARLIHQEWSQGNFRDKPFVKVNCAAMPADLAESELFGHEKGAFTGAYIDRPGKFEFANGGTIFLDEIGEFAPSTQAKLLQVMQEGRFCRLGSNEEIQVDVRIIAATNRNLEEGIRNRTFRQDLYYRLNVVNIHLIPLRERKEEIPMLAKFFVEKFGKQYGREVGELPSELLALFGEYHWPGNIRELENFTKRYLLLRDAEAIQKEIEAEIARQRFDEIKEVTEEYFQTEGNGEMDLKEASRRAAVVVEKSVILKTLQRKNWNKWQTAKKLGVSYKTLLNKIDQYDIRPAGA